MREFPKDLAVFETRIDDLFRLLTGARVPFGRRPFIPSLDVYTRDGDMVVRLELPGIEPEKDVHVLIEQGDLVIRGERKQQEEVREEDYYRLETSYGSFERRVPVPEGIDPATVSAQYVDGVLTVTVLKSAMESAAPLVKEIPIKVPKLGKAA